jgi:uncharacterized protein YoaH (UPF0181 family)
MEPGCCPETLGRPALWLPSAGARCKPRAPSAGAAESFAETLSRAGVDPFLTEWSDIEGYFLNAEHLHALNPGVAVERIQELLAQATSETAAKSVEAIVNQRTREAFDQRRDRGAPPNHGAIAVQAQRDYADDPVVLRAC